MATLTIRDLDDAIRDKLRVRAAERGTSMEAEVRKILAAAVEQQEPERGMGSKIHALFAEVGGLELDLPPRTGGHRPIDLDE